mmetsp:Transcript_55359/g.154255  ORF Transcript_55359/g.154255 Transcript_55359/m.154255 type:complete len:243 (-) Transcript_55359:413-1141(-)
MSAPRSRGDGRLHDHVVEAVDLVGGADGERAALVHRLDLEVQHAVAGHAVRGLPASHLHQPTEGRGLEGQAQLGGRRLGGGVGKHALLLGELLADVWHEATGVAERVLVLHVVVDQLAVAVHLLGGAEVRRGEDLAVLLDLDLLAGADPLVAGAAGEFVHAVVQGDEGGCARAVEHHEAHHLVAARGAKQAGGLVPDADDGANRPVVVDDGAAVQRVPAQHELPVGVGLDNLGLLFRRRLGH